MNYVPNRLARDAAESTVKSLNDKGLHTLSTELSKAIQFALWTEKEARHTKSAESVAIARESHRRMVWIMQLCEKTMRDVADAPITHSDGEVHAGCQSMTPNGAVSYAYRIVNEAKLAQIHCDRAIELARPALKPQPVVTVN